MGFIFDTILWDLVLGTLLIFWLFYRYITSSYTYWKNISIAYEEPVFPFGTDKDFFLFRQPMGHHLQSPYMKFKKEKVVGMFSVNKPYLLVRDPGLLKQLLTKDFHHFVDRGFIDSDVLGPLLQHLFNMKGESWKIMRHKLIPAFTSGRMKMMYSLMEICSNELVIALEPLAEQNKTISVKDFVACFTTDVIASCGFGLETNSIQNPNNEFRRNGNKLFEFPKALEAIKQKIVFFFPWTITKLHLLKPNSNNPEADAFFLKIVGDTVAYREKNNVVRNDFIDILIKIKNNKILFKDERCGNTTEDKDVANDKPGLTLEEMTAQAVLFFAAGFETTSSTIAFCLYEISVNPEIQEKIKKEVDEVLLKHNGKPNYQALKEMIYMEAVINETLRRYSSLAFLERKCTEDYRLPDLNFVIPKGMSVIIPAYCIHHDPEYYPDPYKFDPERFTDDKVKTRNNYTFMPSDKDLECA